MRRAPQVIIALYAAYLCSVILADHWSVIHRFWTSDDAFFYLTIARNVARGVGSSFDGLSLTNGYQPLWLAILSLVFRVTGPLAPADGVRVVLALSAVCAVGGAVIVVRLLRRLSASPVVAVAGVLCLLASWGFWFFGLEAHLNVVVAGALLTLAWQRWESAVVRERWSLSESLSLAVAAALLVLTRVDLLAWAAVLLLGVSAGRWLAGWPTRLIVRSAAVEQGVSATIVVSYLAANRAVFGGWLPISAALRTTAPRFTWRALSFYYTVDAVQLALMLAVSLLMLVAAARLVAAHGRSALAGTRAGFGAALAVGVLVHTAATLLCSVSVEPRYLVTSASAVVVIMGILLTDWTAAGSRRRAALTHAVVAVCAAAVAGQLTLVGAHRLMTREADTTDLSDLAQFRGEITRVVRPNATIFVVDFSGELAWFCDCHVINGDGLVNTWMYQRFVAERRVKDFLDVSGVDYVIETTGESRGGVVWVDGYDWRAIGAESFPIVGFPTSAALASVGQFRLFGYPGQAIVPAGQVASVR